MYFISSLNASALKEFEQLAAQYAKDKKAFTVISDSLECKKLNAYQGTTIVSSNSMALGASAIANTQTRLPHTFHIKNQNLIEEVEEHRQRMIDSKDALSTFKHKVIAVIAKEQVEQYESLAGYIADAHAIIGAIEKHTGNFNSGIWNKISIPADTNLNRLKQRADQPFGKPMLHYDHKAKTLTQKYQAELKEFLTID